MKIEELTNFLVKKLKDLEEIFIITQDNREHTVRINRKEYKYKEIKVYLPDIYIPIRITNNNKLDYNIINNLFNFITYLILRPYIYYFGRSNLYIHENQLIWDEHYSYDLGNIQKSLIKFHNDFINYCYKLYKQKLFIFNNNFFICNENDIDIIKQLSKYINTDNCVYILESSGNTYQLRDFNTIFNVATENIDILKNVLKIYSKTYKPIVLTGADLEIDVDSEYIKFYITNILGSENILALINTNNLNKLYEALKCYHNNLYEFNKIFINNIGYIINSNLFIDINNWLTDNITSIYEDNNIDYWFKKMIVDLTL